jgi:hypothetical protein
MKCSGAPLDRHGIARDTINDCPFEPVALVLGLYPDPDGHPIQLLIACCALHKTAVLRFVAHLDPEAFATPIEALPVVRAELGPDTWDLRAVAA